MEIKTLNIAKSETCFSNILNKSFEDDSYYQDLDNDYLKIREDIIALVDFNKKTYDFDLDLGFKLYKYFEDKNYFNINVASNYDFWRYLSIKVLPEIAFYRHGLEASYYYSKGVRIYLSALWWYIYLSWQGSEEETRKCLSKLSTDYILNLVERPGRDGNYVEVFRLIFKKLGKLSIEQINEKKFDKILFRRLMIQNTAICSNYNLAFDKQFDFYVNLLFNLCGVKMGV